MWLGVDSLRGHSCPLHPPTRSFPSVKEELHWTLAESGKTDFMWATAVGERDAQAAQWQRTHLPMQETRGCGNWIWLSRPVSQSSGSSRSRSAQGRRQGQMLETQLLGIQLCGCLTNRGAGLPEGVHRPSWCPKGISRPVESQGWGGVIEGILSNLFLMSDNWNPSHSFPCRSEKVSEESVQHTMSPKARGLTLLEGSSWLGLPRWC